MQSPCLVCVTVSFAHIGGPERWRVISISCGGRHSLALALPDNDASSSQSSPSLSRTTSNRLWGLPPGEPLRGTESPVEGDAQEEAAEGQSDLLDETEEFDGEHHRCGSLASSPLHQTVLLRGDERRCFELAGLLGCGNERYVTGIWRRGTHFLNSRPYRCACNYMSRAGMTSPQAIIVGWLVETMSAGAEEAENMGGRSPVGNHPPQDLVSVLDQQEAEEDAEAADANGGVPPDVEEYAMEAVRSSSPPLFSAVVG